jgi:AbrB family looped-hinge helix DNA binding protein
MATALPIYTYPSRPPYTDGMRRVVQRFGGSLVVTIPADIARRLSIREGDSVEVDEEGGGIMIRPAHSLADLVAGWDDLTDIPEADLARDIREERDRRSRSL